MKKYLSKGIKVFLGILLTLILIAFFDNHATIFKSCLFGGCYGPFKLVVKTRNGEHIKDVVVGISRRGYGSFEEAGPLIYNEFRVVDSDEVITFPRGFIGFTKDTATQMNFNAYHPDYESLNPYLSFATGQESEIDLGVKYIKSSQAMHEASIAKQTKKWRKEGLSEEEIDEKVQEDRGVRPGAHSDYFAYLTALGREDLVKKYLPDRLKKMNKYYNDTAAKSVEREHIIRSDIKEMAKRL